MKYEELTGYGYAAHVRPYDVTPTLRFAMVDDPDGNTILLSASTGATAAEPANSAARPAGRRPTFAEKLTRRDAEGPFES